MKPNYEQGNRVIALLLQMRKLLEDGVRPIVVNTYNDLPAASSKQGLFYWVSQSQGTPWLPGTLGGTYYPKGLYYSNGIVWSFMDSPYQATAQLVTQGTNNNRFITPLLLENRLQERDPEIKVTSINDLPAPVSGVITLPSSGSLYGFYSMIDLGGNDIILGNNSFRGTSQELAGLENGRVIVQDTCTIQYFRFNNLQMIINATLGAFDWTKVNFYNSPNCIDVQAADNIVFNTFGFINSYGFKISGNLNSLILSPNCIFRSVTVPATMFELTATANIGRRIRIQDSVFATDTGQTAIKVHPSATIGVESFLLNVVRFTGPGTYLDGISGIQDIAFFTLCDGILNSTAIANMYVKNNATETVITVQNDRYNVLGTTEISTLIQRFTHDSVNNAVTYTSSVERTFKVQCTFTLLGNTNNVIGTYLGVARSGNAINPTLDRITESEVYITANGSRPDSGAVQAFVNLSQGDRVYLITQNTSGTQNVTYVFLQMTIERNN